MDTQDVILENIACEKPISGDSLKKRWLYKFFANVIGFGMGFITQSIVPRGLGPTAYGNFSFLSNFFTQLVSFFEMGTSTCFYTRLSQRQKERELVSFYLYFIGFVAVGVAIFVAATMITVTYPKFWPGQEVFYIYLAAGFGILTLIVFVLNNMADAYGITIMAEKIKILQKALAVLIVVLLYVFNQINLANFFYLQYAILLFLIFSFLYIMKREGHLSGQRLIIAFDKVKKYAKEFYNYSHPLFIFSFIGMFVNILDRWLLQLFGGSIQQGFFGFSFQISALCFLFAGALTPLLMREFSISYAKKDIKEMSRLFQRYMPVLLFVTAFLTCFIASQAGTIIQFMGGEKYKGSLWPVFIMAFYPIYQVHGQVCGSVFFATDETKLYCNIGIFFMLIGIPITYFLIAPKALWGLNSGAIGLAAKTMLLQILAINVLLYHNAKVLKFSIRKHLFNQVINIGLLLLFAFLASFIANLILGFSGNNVLKFFFTGLVYTATVAAVIYVFPDIFTLRKDDINDALQIGFRKLNNIFRLGH